jgi:DNA-binding LacI/PurR family transcriptional regulator
VWRVKARLKTIAEMAGVSEATVSRVLNAQPGVSDSTRAKVLGTVDILGYERPTRLRPRSAGLVGLIVPELDNPVFPALAQIIETELSRHQYTAVLCTQTQGAISEDDYVAMLLERNVSGIVFVSGAHASTTASLDRYHRLREQHLPVVFVNGFAPDVDAPFISCDDTAAVTSSLEHLVALGHSRIGLAVGPARYVPVVRKVAAFENGMRALTGIIETGELVACTTFSVDGGAEAADILLDRGCTAIVCASDPMALGAIRAVRARGLDVPSDISVVGYDDSPMMVFTNPPLTTVRQPVIAMGVAAAKSLLDEIGGNPAPRAEFMFRPELIVRASTGPAHARTQQR